MDKEKFTPGPWTYDGGFTVFSADGEPVCDLVSDAEINGRMRMLPYKENAALIEAAPTMYEILETVVELLREDPSIWARMSCALLIEFHLKMIRGEKTVKMTNRLDERLLVQKMHKLGEAK